MRFLGPILRRLFKPDPPAGEPATTIDLIARDVDAAVAEHQRVTVAANASHERALRDTMNDLFKRMGKHDDADG